MGSYPLLQSNRHFCSLTLKMGLRWAYRRLHVRQMADFDFLQNYESWQFQNLTDIALDSLYISTGNDVARYFRSAENRIKVFILGQFRVAISR